MNRCIVKTCGKACHCTRPIFLEIPVQDGDSQGFSKRTYGPFCSNKCREEWVERHMRETDETRGNL